jgi:hypothetical protein
MGTSGGRLAVIGLDRLAILLVFLVQVSVFPYFPALNSANELSRLYTAWAMVDGDLEIGPSIARFGDVNHKSKVADSFFSDKPPGTAFLAVPGIALRQALGGDRDAAADLRIARLLASILPTLFLLMMLRIEMSERGISAPTRALAIATYGLGTLGFTYGVLFYGHQLVAVLVYGTWFALRRQTIGPQSAAIAGFLAGLCVATEYQSAVYLLPLAAVFLVRARPIGPALVAGLAGAATPLAALAAFHASAFGAPWKTGYSFVANPFFAKVHAQGFMGVLSPRLVPFAGSLFSASKGLLAWSPFLALGLAGMVSHIRTSSTRLDRWIRVFQVGLPVLFVSSMVYWDGGWTVSQRHLTPMVPFLVAPAALLIQRSSIAAIVAPGLAAASVMMTGLATVVFPHLPENWSNPFHDLVIPLAAGGCWVRTSLGIELPSVAFLSAAAGAFLVLVTASIAWGPLGRMRTKMIAVVLMAMIPLAWFDGTSRIARRAPAEAAAERVFFVGQCKAAGRWDAGVTQSRQ